MIKFFVVHVRINGEVSIHIVKAKSRADAKTKMPENAEIISVKESK